jgi:alpha,alpha-trehalose phosphorylase
MIHRERLLPPDFVYPPDEWKFIEKRFYPRFLSHMETIFAVGNGYIGMRGNFEEGEPSIQTGTFINGFHETWPITYGEEAFGFAKTGQTMLHVPETKIIKLYVDDEPFSLSTANLLKFERRLDMKAGTLDREILWETPSGKQVSIVSRRLVSFRHRHLAAISYRVEVKNDRAALVISSKVQNQKYDRVDEFDPRKARAFKHQHLVPRVGYKSDRRILLGYTTQNSGMNLACGIDHVIETGCPHTIRSEQEENSGEVFFSVDAMPGQAVHIEKFITYHTSGSAPPEELSSQAERTLEGALKDGFEALLDSQKIYLDDFWRRSDIHLSAGPSALKTTEEMQQAIRFNLFHIAQASGRAEGTGIPTKGLTGQTYEGHYFWDTEIYVLPFLIYTAPRIAKNLLKFRHSMLDKARERARELNHKGALFPWRTINGEEASAYYAAGTAQYHINADIIYGLRKYVELTGDRGFLHDFGAEMLVETARLWADLGFFSDRKGGKFCINGVTGPDEYNTVVDNNTYTNLMARENLRYAARTVESIRDEKPELLTALVDRTGLNMAEIEEWKEAAEKMYIPYDGERGIHPQDDSFLNKKRWDFENKPLEKYPLLLHYHPLEIYRSQVIKQADMVLAMFLLGQEFTPEQKKRNFDFYDELTTGDSSLSVSIQSILANEIGDTEKATEYAKYSVLMDLGDVGGNVGDGCHIASMGGTWMVVVYGLAGMRDFDGRVSFNPRIPHRLKRIRFALTIRDQMLEVEIDHDTATYTLLKGGGITIFHEDREIRLSPDSPTAVKPVSRSTTKQEE